MSSSFGGGIGWTVLLYIPEVRILILDILPRYYSFVDVINVHAHA